MPRMWPPSSNVPPSKKMLPHAATLLLFVTLVRATALASGASAAAEGRRHAAAAARIDVPPQQPSPPTPPPVASANLLLDDGQLPTGHIVNLTRHHDGDVFHTNGVATCNVDTCVGLSSGTATIAQFNADKADMLHHASLAGGGNNGQLELLTRRTKAQTLATAATGAAAATATAAAAHGIGESCQCRCLPYSNTYREDLGICVDDVHECTLSPFVSGSSSEKIPYVFLPLRTQIIYPSREISFPDIRTPVCAVTGAQYLTTNGWSELRNPLDNDYPFRMFRDEGRTFLQWLGESDLRQKMQGRLIVVHLVCRDMSAVLNATAKPQKNVFSPCVAFRVNGTPVKYANNVSEVLFQSESTSTLASTSDGMSTKEYIVIGVCSLLLGLIYVSSVFLYLHMKKRKRSDPRHMRNSLDDLANEINYPKNDQVTFGAPFNRNGSIYSATSMGTSNEPRSRASIGSMKEEMGIVKNNPLLQHFPQLGDHHSGFTSDISNSNSECEMDGGNSFHEKLKQMQTSALVHPQMNGMANGIGSHSPKGSSHGSNGVNGSSNNFLNDEESLEPSASPTQENECLPVENVSIVEDMMTEEKLENLRAMVNGNVRKKLYFNPAYFEPHLLAQPPPAAIEFLQKIREVIAIAKYKMATKRYQPSLIMIPEEGTPRSETAAMYNSNAQPQTTEACQACASNRCSGHVKNCGDKRNSIEKWLQSVAIKEECGKTAASANTLTTQANVIEEVPEDSSPEPQRKSNGSNSNIQQASSRATQPPANFQRPSPRREITPPKQRPPPPPVTATPTQKQSHIVEVHGQGVAFQPLYAKGNMRGGAPSSSLNRHYESFSALSAAANIYGFAEMGSEIYNNPKFCLHDSPNASQRSHSSHRSRKRLDALDQYAAASTPTSLTSAERQHYDMLRNMKQTPEMILLGGNSSGAGSGACGGDANSQHDGQGTLTSNGSCSHLDIPTPDYDSTMEKKYKDIYNSAHSSVPSVPTPDYSTLSRKSLKQGQPPDSPIYRRKSPQYLIVDYETDSLERLEAATKRKSSQSSSSPSSDVSSQLSPSLSTALPLEEELEINHTVYNNKVEGFREKNDVKRKAASSTGTTTNSGPTNAVSTKSSSRGSGKKKDISARIKYDTPFRGSMTIEVEHEPPSDVEPSTDGEQFEAGSTLGRGGVRQQSFCDVSAWSRQMQKAAAAGYKGPESLPDMSRRGQKNSVSCQRLRNDCSTSTAYESRIELRMQATAGSCDEGNDETRPSFNSLREIYQSQLVRQNSNQSCKCGGQARQQLQQQLEAVLQTDATEQGRLLTLEAKHSRRQRVNEPPTPPPIVEITKVANNKTTIKISTPKVNRATLPAKGPPEAAHIEPQVHSHHSNFNRTPSAYSNHSFANTKTHPANGSWNEASRKRSPPTPPPPPPQQHPNSANTTLSSHRNHVRHHHAHYQNHSHYAHHHQQSATEEETASNHSESTEITGISDTLATNSEHNATLSKPVAYSKAALLSCDKDNGEIGTIGSRRGGKQLESPLVLKKLQQKESGDYGAMFNTQINGLRSDYSLTKYLNRRKSQKQSKGDNDGEKGGQLEKLKQLAADESNNNVSISVKNVEYEVTRSSGQLSDRTKELYRNAGVPVGIAYPQRSSASAIGSMGGGISVTANASTAVAVNNNVQTVYRCEIEPLQLTHGMQIAMGLKDRAKKAKDLKNAWRKFVSMAAAKFSPTQSPAPPFDKKSATTSVCASPSPSFFEVLDRDEGISSLIDEQAQAQLSTTTPPVPSVPSPPPHVGAAPAASQNYYEQRFGVRPPQEMDSGYMSADSAEVYKRNYYDRYNFRMLASRGEQHHIITVDTIEDQSDQQSIAGNGGDGSRRSSLMDSNRFEDLEHNMGDGGSPQHLNAIDADLSDAESDKTLTQANAMRNSNAEPNLYSSEDEEQVGRSSSTCGSSETDGETNAEDMWESGAESIETHSVLYKNVRKS